VPAISNDGKSILSRLSEAEENGYQGTYFTSQEVQSPPFRDGYIASSSPVDTRHPHPNTDAPETPSSEIELPTPTSADVELPTPYSDAEPDINWKPKSKSGALPQIKTPEEDLAEVVFFEYGVVVFFGLEEGQERGILEDIENAGILKRRIKEDDWEVEECHFAVPLIFHPVERIDSVYFFCPH
jgi:uncharacterized Rmd1/YagE family protein